MHGGAHCIGIEAQLRGHRNRILRAGDVDVVNEIGAIQRLGELPGTGGFEDGRVPDAEVPLFARIVRAAVAQQDTIDRMLAEALPADWPLARIDPVLRAVMRAATAEMAMAGGPPTTSTGETARRTVAISDAILQSAAQGNVRVPVTPAPWASSEG